MFYKIWLILFLLCLRIYALNIDTHITTLSLLSQSKIYIDYNRSENIHTIQNKTFYRVNQEQLGFGYAPKLNLWIAIDLNNTSNTTLYKTIEYANPLTSYVSFYDAQTQTLLKKDGLLSDTHKTTIHPVLHIVLPPHSSKHYYIQASSKITTMIVSLQLYDTHWFYQEELHYRLILALFFGAMAMIITYNFMIWLITKEISYLYYVLAFMGIALHHLLYKGMAQLYLPPSITHWLIEHASFIVALPVFFLALYTKTVLNLGQYRRINTILKTALFVFPLLVITLYMLGYNALRSLPPVLMLGLLFVITIIALIRRNPQASYLIVGWIVFFTSAAFMFLSSAGIFDIFIYFPHYTEVSLLIEAIIFSFILAHKIKQLQEKKMQYKNQLIKQKQKEEIRLKSLVDQKTYALQNALKEKDLLLKELNHRVKNSIQTITSFLKFQIDHTKNDDTRSVLQSLENRILSINHLYANLHTRHDLSYVYAYEYFSLITDNIQTLFDKHSISVTLDTIDILPSEYAVYCGFIINEAVSNAYEHAFPHIKEGHIHIVLSYEKEVYRLSIQDNGTSQTLSSKNSLGLSIIQMLTEEQLQGTFSIEKNGGTAIIITWRDHEED